MLAKVYIFLYLNGCILKHKDFEAHVEMRTPYLSLASF